MSFPLQTPVVFIVFNRPGLTARVFERIRNAKPSKLFIIGDGPRPDRTDEAENVSKVREFIANAIDWECQVEFDYSDTNLGCRHRVASGLNRVFEKAEEAIILEDDCLPDPTFFRFCSEMLTRYRSDPAVMHISGTNLAAPDKPTDRYRFSHHPWIWGWATWRRAWQLNDFDMASWDERKDVLKSSFSSAWEAQYWISIFSSSKANLAKANTWGFPWMYTCRSLKSLCVTPCCNLIQNLGIGVDSTHMQDDMAHLNFGTFPIRFPLKNSRHRYIDRFIDEKITRIYSKRTGIKETLVSLARIGLYSGY